MASETSLTPPRAEPPEVVRERLFAAKRRWHEREAALSLVEKVRRLLALQEQVLPLVARQRPLAPWERPWRIRP